MKLYVYYTAGCNDSYHDGEQYGEWSEDNYFSVDGVCLADLQKDLAMKLMSALRRKILETVSTFLSYIMVPAIHLVIVQGMVKLFGHLQIVQQPTMH